MFSPETTGRVTCPGNPFQEGVPILFQTYFLIEEKSSKQHLGHRPVSLSTR
jgi:hypothetical protein